MIGYLEARFPGGYGTEERAFLTEMLLQLGLLFLLMTAAAALFSHIAARRLTSGLRDIGLRVRRLQEHPDNSDPPAYQVRELDELAEGVRRLSSYLQQEEERRRRFIGDVTHELRTPLAALRSQVEAFQDGVLEPTEARLAGSHAELMRLVRLVSEMERLFEAEGEPPLFLAQLDADELLADAAAAQEPMFQEKTLTLHTELQPVSLHADPDRLHQIVTNLLHNAWKFTPEGGSITLRLYVDTVEEEAVIEVEDDGPGLQDGEQQLVFDRFYQADSARSGAKQGLGIGLSIAAGLAKAHRGSLYAANVPNGGARFTLRLPLNS